MSTLTQLQEDLALYRAARQKILTGQEYTIGNQRLRRPDLAVIEKTIRELETRIAMIEKSSGKFLTSQAIFGR